MNRDSYSACLYEPSLEAALQDFHHKVWPRAGRPEDREATDRPTRPSSPVFLFLKNDQVIGHLGTIPVSVRHGERVIPAHWIVGLMVLPEFRNGLVGPQLIKKVNETLNFAMTLHVEDSVSRIVKGLKWTHLGVIPQYVHVLNGKRLAQQLRLERIDFLADHRGLVPRTMHRVMKHPVTHTVVGLGASVFRKAWLLAVAGRPGCAADVTVAEERGFDETYDELWDEIKHEFGALVVRDQAYLTAKYGDGQGPFHILACREGSRLRAFMVVKIRQFENDPRMGHARVATIVDGLFNPREDQPLDLLLHQVRGMCESQQVDAMFCTASHAGLQRKLKRHAFLAVPGSLRFAYFDRDHVLADFIPLSEWHIMRGDADAAVNL